MSDEPAGGADQSQALLERLSVATQAAGIYCWELDWKTYAITWDESRLPAAEAAAASRRHFGAELGSDLFKWVHPDDQHAGGDAMSKSLARGEDHVSFRYRLVLPDRSIRHVQAFARTYCDAAGKPQRSLGVSWDVTAEVEAAEQAARNAADLEALSMRFGIAMRAANAGLWEHRVQTGEIWWNETMYVIYGCSAGTFRPTVQAATAMIHPDDLGVAQTAWDNALCGSNQLHVQFRIVRPDGSIAHLDALATVVTGPNGSDPRLVGISLDISERVAGEQRERRLQKQLREASHQSGMTEVATGVLHNVGNVLNSLGVASATAQMRLKAWQVHRVGQVAAMLDENRGTLAEFLTNDDRGKRVPEYLTSLAARLESDAEATRQDFDAISGHVQYLCQIIQAQQSFARVGSAHDEVDVSELIETALTLKGQDLNGVAITRDIGDLPLVRTDRYKLLQIIVNFIANAHDAVIENSSTEPRIAIRVRTVLDRLEVAVEDSGIGIAPQLLARVWEFGFTTKTHGHGFGLHSAAVAAQQLGGTISAESGGVGQGARFSVTIPINSPAQADRVAAA